MLKSSVRYGGERLTTIDDAIRLKRLTNVIVAYDAI